MTNVVDMNEFRKKKNLKKRKVTSQTDKGGPAPFPYSGKLGEAMRKYGSSTGNVMKEQFKKKDNLSEDDDNVI